MTKNLKPKKRRKKFVSYEKSKEWALQVKIKSSYDWSAAKTIRPNNVPSEPWKYYTEWTGWKSFLTPD